MVGFKELLRRLQIQEQMTKQHQTRVDVSAAVCYRHKKDSLGVGRVPSDYQQRNFEADFVVSRTEYTHRCPIHVSCQQVV